MKTNRAVIVQCRLSSTRLPGKALKKIGNKTVLEWTLEAMHKVHADRYFVATDFNSFEELKPFCVRNGFEIFAGDLNDVLKRFCDLIKEIECKTVIRATADNPFLFYEAAEASCKEFEEKNKKRHNCDYLTWTGLPHGSGVEIFSGESLLKAATLTTDPYDHEHVGPALYKHQNNFACEFVPSPKLYNHPELRTTIDTYSDYLRAQKIAAFLFKQNLNAPFTATQITEACNSSFVKNPVILCPSVVKGQGTGHLQRCLKAAVENDFFVYIPENKTLNEADSIVSHYLENGLKDWQIISALPDQTYLPVIVTDSFKLTEKQLEEFSVNKALVSIDEGSEFTESADYLLDVIPSADLNRLPNLFDSDFIQKPENVRAPGLVSGDFHNILVCFGGEDPAKLTIPAAISLSKAFPEADITAVKNLAAAGEGLPEDENGKIKIVPSIPELREKLFNYDLVLTHYGLTAFEALYAGCKVLLLPTSKLHKKLAQKYNFSFLEPDELTKINVQKALEQNSPVIQDSQKKSISQFIQTVSEGTKMCCPVCQTMPLKPDRIISRNSTRTYRRCQTCGMSYMSFTLEANKRYEKAYFFEDYKKQYGKTYQEDFDSIKNQGIRRISVIHSIAGTLRDKNLFDIGCAYGPFLQAAAEKGLNSFGTDISKDAVEYVQHNLRFPATVSTFPDLEITEEFGISQFDIVTMWYVIEHFKNLKEVLEKVSQITKKGGIFAFSTPSGEGVSCKTDLNHFYQISPTDHYTIWEPSKAAKILKKFGFEVVKVVSTGHHPERFNNIKKTGAEKDGLLWKMTDAFSHACKLGDTCEIYCKKL